MRQHAEILDLISSSDVNLSVHSLLNYLSDDVEYFMLASCPDAPLLRQFCGREFVAEYLSILPQVYEIASRSVAKVVYDGPYTIMMGQDIATVYPNKRKVIANWTLILVIRLGKIQRMQYIFQNMTDAISASA
ncbi:MAG: hypothetical protein JNJ46_21695 [Myxococcales bacterium]|nr:hypothetical protein [Myxococcales bacterium]